MPLLRMLNQKIIIIKSKDQIGSNFFNFFDSLKSRKRMSHIFGSHLAVGKECYNLWECQLEHIITWLTCFGMKIYSGNCAAFARHRFYISAHTWIQKYCFIGLECMPESKQGCLFVLRSPLQNKISLCSVFPAKASQKYIVIYLYIYLFICLFLFQGEGEGGSNYFRDE